jgi:DNA-binding transcriptional regulator PaaX
VFAIANILVSLESSLNIRPDKKVEKESRYLHHSEFRTNPDLEYERRVSDALRDIENQQRELHGSDQSWDIIWQMLLKDAPNPENRGQDSLRMEEQNSEWSYKVIPKPLGYLSCSLGTVAYLSMNFS